MIEKFAAVHTKTWNYSWAPGLPEPKWAPHSSLCLVFHGQVEALLASEDYGKDLASVNNLLKKHQLLEADISAHEVSRGWPGQCLGAAVH